MSARGCQVVHKHGPVMSHLISGRLHAGLDHKINLLMDGTLATQLETRIGRRCEEHLLDAHCEMPGP